MKYYKLLLTILCFQLKSGVEVKDYASSLEVTIPSVAQSRNESLHPLLWKEINEKENLDRLNLIVKQLSLLDLCASSFQVSVENKKEEDIIRYYSNDFIEKVELSNVSCPVNSTSIEQSSYELLKEINEKESSGRLKFSNFILNELSVIHNTVINDIYKCLKEEKSELSSQLYGPVMKNMISGNIDRRNMLGLYSLCTWYEYLNHHMYMIRKSYALKDVGKVSYITHDIIDEQIEILTDIKFLFMKKVFSKADELMLTGCFAKYLHVSKALYCNEKNTIDAHIVTGIEICINFILCSKSTRIGCPLKTINK